MSTYEELKKIWKRLRINGQVKNYSSKKLWVLETNTGVAIAHILLPGQKSPQKIDADAFKRVDGIPVEKHFSWWKFYDFSTVDVFDDNQELLISVITKRSVDDSEFEGSQRKIQYNKNSNWGERIRLIINVVRDEKNKRIIGYQISDIGVIGFDQVLEMVCNGEIDNARPVFSNSRKPYIRTQKDKKCLNNIVYMGHQD
ncbi:MAG: hypothetical protein A2381_18635 [Bdellovibrionales bacterium RIFOXYB1_FULL_37_110]|nr:MAG: hypothetical protein A2417_01135 [Bdellovibrionales bacterium RIFOXYC1_FULL_37_79]OFZ59047.1 MAG: hypothetical protein A2381_18635 [Bdellovibrionales bacterium RIFOXYB1_FULL_37_110]OFZ65152.1 MAG: hypothetical protein A2577_04950 [Bdellovibrionales bacterium RIFOXYD1_FULL_36_51]